MDSNVNGDSAGTDGSEWKEKEFEIQKNNVVRTPLDIFECVHILGGPTDYHLVIILYVFFLLMNFACYLVCALIVFLSFAWNKF